MARRSDAATAAVMAMRELQRRREALVTGWFSADARRAAAAAEAARWAGECDRLAGELVATGMTRAQVAEMTGPGDDGNAPAAKTARARPAGDGGDAAR